MSSTRSRYLVAAGAMAAAAYRIQTLSVAGAVVLDWSVAGLIDGLNLCCWCAAQIVLRLIAGNKYEHE